MKAHSIPTDIPRSADGLQNSLRTTHFCIALSASTSKKHQQFNIWKKGKFRRKSLTTYGSRLYWHYSLVAFHPAYLMYAPFPPHRSEVPLQELLSSNCFSRELIRLLI